MTVWRVNNSAALGGEICAPWVPGHAYSLGARCVCRIAYGTVARRAFVFECTTAGTSHAATEPTWPTSGTVNDNDVVWTCRSPGDGNWDNASCILHYVLNHAAAASDIVYVDDGHSEATNLGAGVHYILLGSALPAFTSIYCVDKASDALSVGAVVRQTGTGFTYMRFSGHLYSYGVQYRSKYFDHVTSGGRVTLESNMGTVLSIEAAGIAFLSYGPSEFTIRNGAVNFEDNAAFFELYPGDGEFIWRGGSVIAASGVSNMFYNQYNAALHRKVTISDVDLSAMGSGASARGLVRVSDAGKNNVTVTRCKLPSAAGFTVPVGAWSADKGLIRLHHCASDNRYYGFLEVSYRGTAQDETTIIRTGGASDGATGQAIKMVSTAAVSDRMPLISPPMHAWNTATAETTFSVEIIHDAVAAIQDNEIWMELEYPANNTDGLGAIASSRRLPLGAAADIPDSAEAWTTTGLTNPNTRKISVTCTPGKAGPITARVYLSKASTTVFIDPMIVAS